MTSRKEKDASRQTPVLGSKACLEFYSRAMASMVAG